MILSKNDIMDKGIIDESQKTFSEPEKRIAEILAKEGKNVKSLAETSDSGRNPDAEVDGIPAEFKNLEMGAKDTTVKNVINSSIRRGGQARNIIIDARGSGLTEIEANQGLVRSKNITRGKLDTVRIIGDRYDITFTDLI
jgi:Contact-dependent growth inhibition CdiA C-terminal domain